MGVEPHLPRLGVQKSDFLPRELPCELPFELICELIYLDDFCPTIPDAQSSASQCESLLDGICVVPYSPIKKSPMQ